MPHTAVNIIQNVSLFEVFRVVLRKINQLYNTNITAGILYNINRNYVPRKITLKYDMTLLMFLYSSLCRRGGGGGGALMLSRSIECVRLLLLEVFKNKLGFLTCNERITGRSESRSCMHKNQCKCKFNE